MNQKALALTYQKAVEGFLLHLHAEGDNQSTIAINKWGLSKLIPLRLRKYLIFNFFFCEFSDIL